MGKFWNNLVKEIRDNPVMLAGYLMVEVTMLGIALLFLIEMTIHASAWFLIFLPVWAGLALMILGSI